MTAAAADTPPNVWLCAAELSGESFEALLNAPAVGEADAVLADAALPPVLIEALVRATRHVELVKADPGAEEAARRRLLLLAREGWRVVRCFGAAGAAEAARTAEALGHAGLRFGVIGNGSVAAGEAVLAAPPRRPVAIESWAGLAG